MTEQMTPADPRLDARKAAFWENVDKSGDCWMWTASIQTQGYGQFRVLGKNRRAHRLSYEWEIGPIPEGMILDHTCHDPSVCREGDSCPHRRCVNPGHLEVVTHQENTLRGGGITARQAKSSTCVHGHSLSGENVRIDRHGKRRCRACGRERMRRHLERKRNGHV